MIRHALLYEASHLVLNENCINLIERRSVMMPIFLNKIIHGQTQDSGMNVAIKYNKIILSRMLDCKTVIE